MASYNGKVQMMDAGMVMFESDQNYGNALGQVKAEMEVYGKVLRPSEISEVQLPESTGECDLFMDWSNVFRVRYISCRLENAGEVSRDGKTYFRYAATFKEGNKSKPLRACFFLFFIAIYVTAMLVCSKNVLDVLIYLVIIAETVYIWILPEKKAQKVVAKLLSSLKGIGK